MGGGSFRRFLAIVALASVSPAVAQFTTLETRDLRLLYIDPFQSYLVPHAGRCFENSLDFQRRMLGYTPSEKVTVLLNDFSDSGNASATAVPWNDLALEISPISVAYETVSPNERMNWLMNHELVHIATVDSAAKPDRRARAFFGGKVMPVAADPESILYYYLTVPRDAAPRWYHEGIAVFVETWMAGGQGRAQGAYDEMVFRSMVRDGAPFHDPLSLVSEGTKIDFQVEVNSYLYGTRFMTWLADRYTPERLVEWVSRGEGSRAYYAKNFKATFGLPLDQAWSDWVAFERGFQQANLEAVRKYPTTPYRDLSARALGSVSRAFLDEQERKLYVAFNYQGLVAHVGAISLDDGAVEPIAEVKAPVLFTVTSLAWDPGSRTLFYTADSRDYRDLMSLDPATGKTRMLLKDARIGDLAFDPADRSLWGVRHFNGIATLVRVPYPYDQWNQVRSWPYGEVLYDLDVSPDGAMLSAAVGGIDGLHTEQVFKIENLLAGRAEPVAKFDFATFIPEGFGFTKDGRYLVGSSYYTGVSNVFRYELATGKVEALSNAETGFFQPIPRDDGSMIVFRYSGQGFVPSTIQPAPLEDVGAIAFLGQQLVDHHPVLKDWQVPSPAKIPLEEMIVRRGPYEPVRAIRSESFYPILEGYKDSPAVGMRFNFSDPVMLDRLTLNASYSPDHDLPESERLHLRLQFHRYDWRVDAKLNAGDFYDLFGPTKTSRKGYSLRVGWDHTYLYDLPRRLSFTTEAAYYGNLETLPLFQNVASPSDTLVTGFARLKYENVRSSIGRVDEEKGQRVQLWLGAYYADGDFVPQTLATYDVGFQLPLTHSSIWLRNAVGAGFGDRTDPFAQFFFGGFGNNWIDHGDEHRYREVLSFPGVEIDEIGGRTFGKSILEWNLPPIRFRRFGTPGFYATWARPSLFVSGLTTDFDGSAVRRTVADAGAQLDVRFTVLSRLDMTLSFGYAAAFENGQPRRNEGMVSLRVLQ